MKSDRVIFIISTMNGAGAERVISILSNYLVDSDKDVSIIITMSDKEHSNLAGLSEKVKVYSLREMVVRSEYKMSRLLMLCARIAGKLGLKDYSAILKYKARNYSRITALKRFFKDNSDATVVAFLYEAMFLSLLSCKNVKKLIISERADPCQLLGNRTDAAFIRRMFCRADDMVFQSYDVMKWYENNTACRGNVIFNPVKPDLPLPYEGERRKDLVNFCRITKQKNLIMLVRAFSLLNKDCPDYRLLIYGNTSNTADKNYMRLVKEEIENSGCRDSIMIFPARNDIHEVIKDCAMFVSSSDYEGMSNSMLEAMAMGMPVVCTDCPAGGARAVIKDHENGLLTPVGDAEALYKAMKEVIENPGLAKKIGENAAKIREEQSVEKITKKWMEIIK